jgi:hypothetical protein
VTRKRSSRSRRTTALSRRRFIALMTGGALASAASPPPAPAAPPAKPRRQSSARTPAIEKGIAEQKGYLAKQLQTIRDYSLPPGSDPAFVFRPLPAKRAR